MSATLPVDYPSLLDDIKERIRVAQVRTDLAVNRELMLLYWQIGRLIFERQQREGWGAGVIPKLVGHLKDALPDIKGFSERNIGNMIRFAREYGSPPSLQLPVANLLLVEKEDDEKMPRRAAQLVDTKGKLLQHLVAKLPWGHNILLIHKIKDLNERLWYMRQTVANGWSRNILALQIKSNAYARAAKPVTNFECALPPLQSDLASQILKDPYIYDFLTLDTEFRERGWEARLIRHLERFLLELGAGFAFVGRQYHLHIDKDDFYIDLLFYHLKLRCYVVVQLKRGKFLPAYGTMTFYLNAVDDLLRHPDDKPSIGLVLCQDKNRISAEYALREMNKPIGISEYQLTRTLPQELKSALPTIDQIEAEFANDNA